LDRYLKILNNQWGMMAHKMIINFTPNISKIYLIGAFCASDFSTRASKLDEPITLTIN
jgi:hypothetical protein